MPDAVARPTSAEEVAELLREASASRTPVTAAGAQTSYVGGSIAGSGTVLSLRALDRVLDVDAAAGVIRVEPGAFLGDVKRAAAALAPVLRAHRKAHEDMGMVGSLEEFSVAAGNAHHLVRPLARRPQQFLFARLERQHANLALLRFKLAEAERSLG